MSISEPPSLDRCLPAGQPDWAAIDFEVDCSRCGYNLRMLTRPRCPECGLEFEWREAFAAVSRRNQLLFEHTWSTRPFAAYWRTLRLGLRPARLWKIVSIHDRIEPRPLWFLLLTAPLVFAALCLGGALLVSTGLEFVFSKLMLFDVPSPRRVVLAASALGDFAREAPRNGGLLVTLLALPASLVWAAGLLLLSLRQTLARCRLRGAQVLRVVAYSATPTCIALAAAFVGLVAAEGASQAKGTVIMLGTLGAAWVLQSLILGRALHDYLRLPRPAAVAVVCTGVALLAFVTVLVAVMVMWQ